MDDAVRILTYNVRRDVPADGAYDWAGRREAVAGTLRLHRPDLVGLQEPLAHQYDDVRAALPGYEWVGRSRCEGEREDEFCPVGYRRDRFERRDAGTFWLSETPEDPGSVGWDASWPRIATWVRLADRRTDADLVYLNTHLDHEGETARREGARLLRDRIPEIRGDAPAVVGGDLNCPTGGAAYAVLAGDDEESGESVAPDSSTAPDSLTAPDSSGGSSQFVDARVASRHPTHGPQTTRTDFESIVPDRRIDHVFVAALAVDHYAVATDMGGDDWYPSDHLPVVVDCSV